MNTCYGCQKGYLERSQGEADEATEPTPPPTIQPNWENEEREREREY